MPETTALLIVAPLTVSSSYGQNVEEPAGESFDTVQFFLPDGGDAVYRVRTFALDHDIHVHQIGWPAESAHDLARTHLGDAYGQVLASVNTIALTRRSTQDLRDAGIAVGELEVASAGQAPGSGSGGSSRCCQGSAGFTCSPTPSRSTTPTRLPANSPWWTTRSAA